MTIAFVVLSCGGTVALETSGALAEILSKTL